jgi:hypothetical protein
MKAGWFNCKTVLIDAEQEKNLKILSLETN